MKQYIYLEIEQCGASFETCINSSNLLSDLSLTSFHFATCSTGSDLFCYRFCLHLAGTNIFSRPWFCWNMSELWILVDQLCIIYQVLNHQETPLLYSLVFGEGVVNDATSVVLFHAIQKFDLSHITSTIAFEFVRYFLYLFLTSTILGVAVSLSFSLPLSSPCLDTLYTSGTCL